MDVRRRASGCQRRASGILWSTCPVASDHIKKSAIPGLYVEESRSVIPDLIGIILVSDIVNNSLPISGMRVFRFSSEFRFVFIQIYGWRGGGVTLG